MSEEPRIDREPQAVQTPVPENLEPLPEKAGFHFSLWGLVKAILFSSGVAFVFCLFLCWAGGYWIFPCGFIAGMFLIWDVAFRSAKSRTPVVDVSLMLAGAVFLFGIAMSLAFPSNPDSKYYSISCASNLKQIGLALKQYAIDNDGYFPSGRGVDGFEILRSKGYMPDYRVFVCLKSRISPGSGNMPLTEKNVSYVYLGAGLKDEEANSDKVLGSDKPDNHMKYGNTLFCDGRVQGFADENWQERAAKEGK